MSINHYTSIIATHQGRIRCLLSKLFNKKFERFKNGAVICLEISPNGNQKPSVECYLLYEGELASNEDKQDVIYYINGDSGQQENYTGEKFETITSNTYNLQFENTNNDKYTFFLIRHGQGEHNILKGNQKRYEQLFGKKDSELTVEGRKQAERAGKSIGKTSPFMLLSANYLFCSDLSRTIQTMAYFLLSLCKTINNNGIVGRSLLPPQPPKNLVEDSLNKGILKSKNIIVLPCSHELTYKKDGNCDGNQSMNPNENLPASSNLSNLLENYEGFNIIWESYARFYNNSSRSAYLNLNKSKCRNTNFIQQAIDYINLNKPVVISNSSTSLTSTGGKKSKKKKTYKKKTYKKKNKKKNLKQKKKTFKRRKRKTRKNNHKRGGEKIDRGEKGALVTIGSTGKNKMTNREAAQQQAIDYERNNQNALYERKQENQLREEKKNSLEQKNRDEVERANRGYLTNLAIKSIQGKREWSDWNPFKMSPNPPPELYK